METIIGVLALAVVCGSSFGIAYGVIAKRRSRKVKTLLGVVLPGSSSGCYCNSEEDSKIAGKATK